MILCSWCAAPSVLTLYPHTPICQQHYDEYMQRLYAREGKYDIFKDFHERWKAVVYPILHQCTRERG